MSPFLLLIVSLFLRFVIINSTSDNDNFIEKSHVMDGLLMTRMTLRHQWKFGNEDNTKTEKNSERGSNDEGNVDIIKEKKGNLRLLKHKLNTNNHHTTKNNPLSSYNGNSPHFYKPSNSPSPAYIQNNFVQSSLLLSQNSATINEAKLTLAPTPAPTINVRSVLARIPTYSPFPHPPSVRQPTIFDRRTVPDGDDTSTGEQDEEDAETSAAYITTQMYHYTTYICFILTCLFFYFQ